MEKTQFVSWKKFKENDVPEGIVRILMCGNDISLGQVLQKALSDYVSKHRLDADYSKSARFYLMRIACSHACEFACLLKELVEPTGKAYCAELAAQIESKQESKTARDNLLKALDKGQILNVIRNRGTFHYMDYRFNEFGSWVQQAIDELANQGSQDKVTMYDEPADTIRFHFVDTVLDRVFVQNILKLSPDKDAANDQVDDISSQLRGFLADIGEIVVTVQDVYDHRFLV